MSAPSPSAGPPPGVPAIQTAARLLAAGRAAEAVDRLRQLVAEAPTYAAAHVLLASALDAADRPSDALDVWRRAAFLVPHSPLVHRERQRLMDAQNASPPAPETDRPEPETSTVDAWNTLDADSERSEEGLEIPDLEGQHPHDEQPESGPHQLDIANLVPSSSDDRPAGDPDERTTLPQLDGADSTADEPDTDETAGGETAGDDSGELATSEPDLDSQDGDTLHPPAEEPATAPDPEAPLAETLDAPLTETPLLPPEGSPEPSAAPVAEDDELEDDGWTIIEDDAVSPPRAVTPEPTSLLPPETDEPPRAPLVEPVGDAHVADDLDDLISQLDAAPRIRPDPTFQGPAVTFDESSVDDMASETLAKIYAAQRQYVQAAQIYEKLAAREPDRADAHLDRAAELRAKADK